MRDLPIGLIAFAFHWQEEAGCNLIQLHDLTAECKDINVLPCCDLI